MKNQKVGSDEKSKKMADESYLLERVQVLHGYSSQIHTRSKSWAKGLEEKK